MATSSLIQLKYSAANSSPISLDISEPAYSFVSDKLFIGNLSGTPIAIGGKKYTDLLEANTSYAVSGTVVTRDTDGSSKFNGLRANTITSNTTIFAGRSYGEPLSGATNPLIGATGNANNYVQSYIRNINGGSEASADYVAYSDIGSDVSGWIDMGINSSTYNSEFYTVTGPEDGYILMSGTNGANVSGNLVIATDSTGLHNDIVFQTGGFTGAKHPTFSLRDGQGAVVETTTASTSNSTGSLVVNGGAGIQGSVYADQLYDFGSRVLSTLTVNSGAGVGVSSSKSGNTQTVTINNTGVTRLTANSGDVTTSATTGNLTFGLATTTVSAGIYGGSTQVPTFTVDTKGRLTQAGNVAISTSFSLIGNTGTDTFNTGDTLIIKGNGTGIVTTVTDNTVSIATDTTVLRSNTSIGVQTISSDLQITGNLIVTGSQVVSNTTYTVTDDSLIQLANNNTTDVLDIGFFGQYGSGGTKYAGLFRKSADIFYLFEDVTDNPTSNVVSFTSDNRGTLDANITGGTVAGLDSAIAIADGGTNQTSFTTGQIVQFDGASLSSVANTGTAGTYGAVSRTLIVTTDALGRVSSVSNNAIEVDASQVTTGTLPIIRGGTNQTSFTSGQRIVFNGTALTSVANSALAAGQYGNSSTIPVFTTNEFGDITAVSNTSIAISTSQITSGTLGVALGGTGSSSFNTNGVVISGAGSTDALTAVTGSAYQILQLNASGIPVFGGLSGGTF